MSFENWRFNLRRSNTEPLIRMNVETRGDQTLLAEKTEELKLLIKGMLLEMLLILGSCIKLRCQDSSY